MDVQLQKSIFQRLQSDGVVDADWSVLVIAACEGASELDAVLESPAPPSSAAVPQLEPTKQDPVGAYLASVTVQGFRGVGPETTLEVKSGPGLMLVVGRNGSGKSSFAEGLEVLLTGESRRWAGRSAVWKEGWRNLHHPHPALVEVRLLVEGQGSTRVTRTWDKDAPLGDSHTEVQPKGKTKTTLPSLGWEEALVTYRPFLSYNELGSMLDEEPSKLFDAVSLVLGLEALVEMQDALAQARQVRAKDKTAVKGQHKVHVQSLQALLDEEEDERARRCLDALSTRTWDLDTVEQVTDVIAESPEQSDITSLQHASVLEAPDAGKVEVAAEALREAESSLLDLSGSDAARARSVAGLLEAALAYHGHHGDADCPVCGNSDALNPDWRRGSLDEAARLRQEAAGSDAAHETARKARSQALELLISPPHVLGQLAQLQIDAEPVTTLWNEWRAGREIEGLSDLAAHLDDNIGALTESVARVREAASKELHRREDRWRPVANRLAHWAGEARRAQEGEAKVALIKEAEKWLTKASQDIRNERFSPIGEKAMAVWQHLRQQSNVELGKIELIGSKTQRQRRVTLDVTVDGVAGAALGVMSQGELHSLALSLFLPRATLPESPFRFVVIDDPVQSMDPARVDGLARALEETAAERQVIVFTHDERLPEAVRRLGIEANVVSVTRRANSVVELRESSDPVHGYIKDAWTLISTDELSDDVRRRVVPGFCRSAIEAACMEVVRRRRLERGEAHTEVEVLLAVPGTLTRIAALALFDDPGRGGDVMARLNQWGHWAGDVFKRCNKGAHDAHPGDLHKLADDAGSLCKKLSQLK